MISVQTIAHRLCKKKKEKEKKLKEKGRGKEEEEEEEEEQTRVKGAHFNHQKAKEEAVSKNPLHGFRNERVCFEKKHSAQRKRVIDAKIDHTCFSWPNVTRHTSYCWVGREDRKRNLHLPVRQRSSMSFSSEAIAALILVARS